MPEYTFFKTFNTFTASLSIFTGVVQLHSEQFFPLWAPPSWATKISMRFQCADLHWLGHPSTQQCSGLKTVLTFYDRWLTITTFGLT